MSSADARKQRADKLSAEARKSEAERAAEFEPEGEAEAEAEAGFLDVSSVEAGAGVEAGGGALCVNASFGFVWQFVFSLRLQQ